MIISPSASPKARAQLSRFVSAAKRWRADDNGRLIDQFGIDNLVMDINREIRFIDSFYVFFFEDMLHVLSAPDPDLEERIAISLERLEYLADVLQVIERANPT